MTIFPLFGEISIAMYFNTSQCYGKTIYTTFASSYKVSENGTWYCTPSRLTLIACHPRVRRRIHQLARRLLERSLFLTFSQSTVHWKSAQCCTDRRYGVRQLPQKRNTYCFYTHLARPQRLCRHHTVALCGNAISVTPPVVERRSALGLRSREHSGST